MPPMTKARLAAIEQSSYQGSRESELAREIRRCWKTLAERRRAIPDTWLDPLLTGPDAVLPMGGTYDGKDIERLLSAIRARFLELEA